MVKDPPLIVGTAGGIIASTLPNISSQHLITTSILAIIGAAISFFYNPPAAQLTKSFK